MSQFSSQPEPQEGAMETPPRSQLGQGWDNLKSDLGRIRDDLSEIAQALMDASKSEMSETRERLQSMAQQRLETVRSALESAKGQGKSTTEMLQRTIEERPLVSIAVAFGVGMMLGSLMNRR